MYQQMLQQPNNGVGFVSQPSNTGMVTQPIQYKQKAAKALGITQMTMGCICFISNIIAFAIAGGNNSISIVAHGVWGGILFIIAGLLEVLSARKTPNIRLIIGAMAMSILAACISAVVFFMAVLEAFLQNTSHTYNHKPHDVNAPIPLYFSGNQHFTGYEADLLASVNPPNQDNILDQPSIPPMPHNPAIGTENSLAPDYNVYDEIE